LSRFWFELDGVSGLLTVDPKKRWTISEVLNCNWLKEKESQYGSTPLLTPGILSNRTVPRAAEMGVTQAFNAFHMAAREGFRLQVCPNSIYLFNSNSNNNNCYRNI